MKNFWLLIFTVVFSLKVSAVAFSFRVQCSSKGNPDLLSVFNKIPERQAYIMPTGSTLYFSGGYFDDFGKAEARLEEVKQLGITDAFIRVFKNRTYLSDHVSASLLSHLALDYSKNKRKQRLIDSLHAITVSKKYEENKYIVLSDNSKKTNQKRHIQKKNENNSVGSTSKEESLTKNDLLLNVSEAPVYKILVGKVEKAGDLGGVLTDLNEIVYENKQGNVVYYTIGHYSTEKAALAAMKTYKNYESFEIVGMYKKIVVSRVMANELLSIYQEKNKK